MNVPILDGGHIVIVAGVGNKDEDYDESDVRQLTLLMEGMWRLIQRQRVQAELQRHRDHLEQLVKERTEALRQSHDELQTIYDEIADGTASLRMAKQCEITYGQTPPICRMLWLLGGGFAALSTVMDIHPPSDCPKFWHTLIRREGIGWPMENCRSAKGWQSCSM